MSELVVNIVSATDDNEDYRSILYTGTDMQLTVMNLNPREKISREKHNGEQFIRVEDGMGEITIGTNVYKLIPGIAAIIPRFTTHEVVNTSSRDLKMYTIYSPPQHEE